jgi:hypothetical protein
MMLFVSVYFIIGFLVSIALLMTHGSEILIAFTQLARTEGMEMGPVAILTAVTLLCLVAWPAVLVDL